MGIGWKQPNRCQHPEHKFQAGKKAPKLRCIPFNTLAGYNENNPPLPVGTAFCFSHLKAISCEHQKNDESEEINADNTPKKYGPPADDIYIPDAAVISAEALEKAANTANSLCEVLVTSPFSFQIKEKRIEDLSDGTKQKVRKKYEQIKMQLEKKFAEAIAPGQSDELISQVLLKMKMLKRNLYQKTLLCL